MLRIQPGTAYLTAFHLVKKGSKPSAVVVSSISPPPGRTFPNGAIVLPYGGKARETIAGHLFGLAHDNNQEIYQIEVGVDIDRLRVKILTLDSLNTTCLMNIKLIGPCVEAAIIDYWCSYLEEEGKDMEWIIEHLGRDVRNFISDRPDLLGRLSQEKEFRHLNMIVFSMPTSCESVDVGMILRRDAITQTGCRTDPKVSVVLSGA